MLLNRIFGLQLSEWEEKLSAAALLAGSAFPPAALNAEAGKRIADALRMLGRLPKAWARELAIEILMIDESNAC